MSEDVANLCSATFLIHSTKFYIPVATLSINHNIKFLENLKQGFKRTVSLNKHRFEITVRPKNSNFDYANDPSSWNIDSLFLLSFKNGDNGSTRSSSLEYYIPLVEIKYFNILLNNKLFFDQPVKNKQEAYEKLAEMLRNYDYTIMTMTILLLDYLYHQNFYKIIGIDLLRQINTIIP